MNMTIGAFRAFFVLKNGLTAGDKTNDARAFVLNFGDDETSISEEFIVRSEKSATATGWYTLDGRRLSGKPTVRGIYISNGKKVVVES